VKVAYNRSEEFEKEVKENIENRCLMGAMINQGIILKTAGDRG